MTALWQDRKIIVCAGTGGVGKTTVVHGFAKQLTAGDVPEALKDLRLVEIRLDHPDLNNPQLDYALRDHLLNLGAQGHQGVILFIDGLRQLAESQDSLHPGHAYLKSVLSQDSLRCIASCSSRDFKQLQSSDSSLLRRFQKLEVPEPDAESTMTLLRGAKERFEAHHGVQIRDAALNAAVKLSIRHLSDRFLPEKAIDFLYMFHIFLYFIGNNTNLSLFSFVNNSSSIFIIIIL